MAAPALSVEGDAAVDPDSGFGIEGFHRAQKGSPSALGDGREVGYRYVTGYEGGLALIATDEAVVLHIPQPTCDAFGLDLPDGASIASITGLVAALDDANANGGVPLSGLGMPVEVTAKSEFQAGGCTFRFDVEYEGRTYAAVEGGASNPLFCDYGTLAFARDMNVAVDRGPFEQLGSFLSRVDLSPLFVSLRTSLVATLLVTIVGSLCAWRALRLRLRVRNALDTLFMIPMVLPPSACGFLLVWVFGKNSPTGQWLISVGVNLPFTWPAAVIAAFVVALPYMYRSALGAFEGIDAGVLDAARTLGWSEARVFARLMVPLAKPELAAGIGLSFARALGEFGATMFFAGNYAGVTQTIPLAIYYNWMGGDVALAWLWVVVMVLFTFFFLLALRRGKDRRSRRRS